MSDNDAIIKVVGGDYEEYKKLKQKYLRPLEWRAYKLLGNFQLAKDISQEGFNHAIDNIHLYDPSKPFFAWVYAIVKNKSIDMLKRRKKNLNNETVYYGGTDFKSETPTIEEETITNEEKNKLYLSMLSLNPSQRIALELFYFSDMKYKDVAFCINKTTLGIGRDIQHAKKNIKKYL